MSSNTNIEFLRIKKVSARIGVGTSTIYAWIAKGVFPKPVKLNSKTIVWPASLVDQWAQTQIDASQNQQSK